VSGQPVGPIFKGQQDQEEEEYLLLLGLLDPVATIYATCNVIFHDKHFVLLN
jgi:hypothetical protein